MNLRRLLLFAAAIPFLAAQSEAEKPAASGPPYDLSPTPHAISMKVETALARDFLTVVSGSPEAPAALRKLRASEALSLGLEAEKVSEDQFFGRLAAAAAGSPDPLFKSVAGNIPAYQEWLAEFDQKGPLLARTAGLRIASLLPARPPQTVEITVIPLFGLARFNEVDAVPDGDHLYFLVDLERMMAGGRNVIFAEEALNRVLRTSASSAWKTLFERVARGTEGWLAKKPTNFDRYLARTVSEGPATLLLIPDEFFPLATFLEEPVGRSFAAWNKTAESILEEKDEEKGRKTAGGSGRSDDFWSRHTAVVGAMMTEVLLRKAGRSALLDALTGGPRAVATLYVTTSKDAKPFALSKQVKKALEPAR